MSVNAVTKNFGFLPGLPGFGQYGVPMPRT